MLHIILSVDWEANHGPYRNRKIPTDYSGIEIGTRTLQKLLDQHHIPITWFLETSWNPERNTPSLFPEHVRRIKERGIDDIGLHIHWSKEGKWGEAYETEDAAWISNQLQHGVKELERDGIRPKFFRSGSFLRVMELARRLQEAGFEADSSTLFGVANQYSGVGGGDSRAKRVFRKGRRALRALNGEWSCYRTGVKDIEVKGDSLLIEFPVSFNVFDLMTPWKAAFFAWLLSRSGFEANEAYITLFFHIDELLERFEEDQVVSICGEKEAFLKSFFEKWSTTRNIKFSGMREALMIARRHG